MRVDCPNCGVRLKIKIEQIENMLPLTTEQKETKKLYKFKVDKILGAYRILKDYKEVGPLFFSRNTKEAQNLLREFKENVDNAVDCLFETGNALKSKNLEWNLSTIIKRIPEWRKNESNNNVFR